jgi:hypothetical protein
MATRICVSFSRSVTILRGTRQGFHSMGPLNARLTRNHAPRITIASGVQGRTNRDVLHRNARGRVPACGHELPHRIAPPHSIKPLGSLLVPAIVDPLLHATSSIRFIESGAITLQSCIDVRMEEDLGNGQDRIRVPIGTQRNFPSPG